MIKKLVKYGNSYAIVIDRAIMELLGMSEGGTVKLRTDGSSLTITPIQIASSLELSKDVGYEQVLALGQEDMDIYHALLDDPSHKDLAEAMREMQKKVAVEALPLQLENSKVIHELIKSDAYKEGLNELVAKHSDTRSKEFGEDLKNLMARLDPRVGEFQKEYDRIANRIQDKKLMAQYEEYKKRYREVRGL